MADSIQLNFSRGEISPYLQARVDLAQYKAGLQHMSGWIPLRYGGMTRLPGTIFGDFAKEADTTARFLPFQFNLQQCYAIEAGDLYFRFWNNTTRGRVESPPGTPVEVVTPYTEDDLKYIQVRQSGDLVFVFCSGFWPRVLTRNSETSWSLDLYVPLDGPYLDINLTATTLDPSAASGSVTITASATTGINGGTGFQSTDVGRAIRFLEAGGEWYWFVITAFTDTTHVTATYMGRDDGNTGAMPGHAASASWRLSAWSVYDGYPAAVGLYEERLITAATTRQPTTVWGTVAQDTGLDDYSIQSPLTAEDAITAKLNGALNSINWIADGKDILLATEGAIRRLGRNDEQSAFGPTNLRQKPESEVSTSYIPGFFVQNALLFTDVYRQKLYAAVYQNEEQGYVPQEISAVNEHLVGLRVTSHAYQKTPHGVIWMTTEEGTLLAATYDRDEEAFGISRCPVGPGATVEWVMVLPGTDDDGDVVWLIVKRTIDGAVVRTVETLSAFYRQGYSAQIMPIYGHCAGIYNDVSTGTITGLDDFEGEVFGVWADGVDLGDVTVVDGEFTLPLEITATIIVWGYRQSSLSRTLRLTDFGTGVPSIGKPVIVGSVAVDVYETPHLRLGSGYVDENDYDEGLDVARWENLSETDPYAAAPFRTETVRQGVDSSWANNGVVVVETNSMHPATVRAITADVQGAD